ncbi:MAG: tripartite tricarboxylate transporter TctB family protein [Actinomycetota bacterium]
MRKIDIVAGTIFTLVGVFVLTRSLRLNFYVEGVPGPGFFPSVLAIALAVTGGLLVVTRLRRQEGTFGDFTLPSRMHAQRSLGLWIAILAAALLVNVVGFLVAMVFLVAVTLIGIERRHGLAAIATIVLAPALAYLLFAQLLQVPLPSGLFGD